MGIRFRKSMNLAPGVRLNLSKSGLGVSVGRRGARFGVGPRGPYTSFGIPGTGFYTIDYLGKGGTPRRTRRTTGRAPGSSLPVPEEAATLPLPEEVATASGFGGFLVFIGAAWFLFNQLWGGIFLLLVILIFLPHFQVARRFKRANRAWDAGRYTEAARHLEEVRRKRPGLKGLNYLLGLAWQEAGEPAKAAPYYEEHLNLEPDDHRARFNLAVCYAGDHPRDALALLQSLPVEAKQELPVIILMGRLFLQLNRPELAVEVLEKGPVAARKMDEAILAFRYYLGLAYKRTGQNRKALTQLRKVYAEDMRYMDVARELRELEGGEGE